MRSKLLWLLLICPLIGYANGPSKSLDLVSLAEKGLEELGLTNSSRMVLIDYSRPSTEKRLFIIDRQRDSLLFSTYVTHGKGSGNKFATSFSNTPRSYQSSLGFFSISESYHGIHGHSIRLDGLEKGINDRARERAIVIHGAWYAEPSMIKKYGRLGRSQGCPALSKDDYKKFTALVEKGTPLFIFHPDENYWSETTLFRSEPGP